MSMLKYLPDADNCLYFIYRDNLFLTASKKGKDEFALINRSTFLRCIDNQCAKDWYYNTDLNYAALMLEADSPLPPDTKWVTMRKFFTSGSPHIIVAAQGLAVLNWRQETRFCPSCGAPLMDHKLETARVCSYCDKTFYPSLSPCIIVRITKGDKMLLARHIQRNTDVYTCLAGLIYRHAVENR